MVPSAAERVLSTPELLEQILKDPALDTKTLLHAQRVSRVFHAATLRPNLQHRLFLAPSLAEDQERVVNPLLEEFFPLFFNQPDGKGFWRAYANHQEDMLSLPLAETTPRETEDGKRSGTRNEAFCRKGASWRRMLIEQPPCYVLRYLLVVDAYYTGTHACPEGLTMGLLYDIVYNVVCTNDNPGGFVMAYDPMLLGQARRSLDHMVNYWMETTTFTERVVLSVIGSGEYASRTLKLTDGKLLDGQEVDWEVLKSEEYQLVKIKTDFFYFNM
jgi:hypothetical protein